MQGSRKAALHLATFPPIPIAQGKLTSTQFRFDKSNTSIFIQDQRKIAILSVRSRFQLKTFVLPVSERSEEQQ